MFNFFNIGSKKKYVCDHSCEEFDQGDIVAKFFKALCHHDKNRIKELLKEGADINCISPVGAGQTHEIFFVF